jgi:hypothetical protein
MAHEISLSVETTLAVAILALVLNPISSMQLHVCFEVVGSLEQLSTNLTRANRFFGRGAATLGASTWCQRRRVPGQRERFEVVGVEIVLDVFGLVPV